ncbi:MAG: YunC family protein [Candidatus Bathyarchaeia archaeon]
MLEVDRVKVDGNIFLGLKADLPDAPPLLVLIGGKGFVMCGYLNLEVAERLNAAAAFVSGVKSFDDMLNAGVKGATSKAKSLGVETGEVLKTVIGRLA